jgi:tRNA-dihydrouridine synthase B
LKIRTGWSRERRNGVGIARIAEASGIVALAVHGRTREDRFEGSAEYATIAEIKQAVGIPVIANGDIHTPQQARIVLAETGVDALMIGRAAQGRPWIFREISHYLATGAVLPEPSADWVGRLLLEHLGELHRLYGEAHGVRIGRKHIRWYCEDHPGADHFWARISTVSVASAQLAEVAAFFEIADLPLVA